MSEDPAIRHLRDAITAATARYMERSPRSASDAGSIILTVLLTEAGTAMAAVALAGDHNEDKINRTLHRAQQALALSVQRALEVGVRR
ncbi:hypothetical protein [Microvirga brassicacearum]|uniref:Uncharacterized protein n=1 Tax=Microvirga brassicacearum TaxID=2580413 RepID=A0A5N3PH14_9HYPH|nr:hypothetical protein [Microvirga brassicacearum]KAB0269026.1 hypothetical protein FEZ63_02655 [Microvirga brassicacearum]